MTHRETVFVGTLVGLFLFSVWALIGQLATGAGSTVKVSLTDVDQALGADDVSRAERAWRRARADVTRRRAWPAYADLGDAALGVVEDLFAEAKLLGRHFQQFVVTEPGERLLQGELLVWVERRRGIGGRGADVRGVLLFGRVDDHVLVSAASSDDHPAIDLRAYRIEQRPALLDVLVGVPRESSRIFRDE